MQYLELNLRGRSREEIREIILSHVGKKVILKDHHQAHWLRGEILKKDNTNGHYEFIAEDKIRELETGEVEYNKRRTFNYLDIEHLLVPPPK